MRKNVKRTEYKVGSLFAGMGGFCLAFANEDFKVVSSLAKDSKNIVNDWTCDCLEAEKTGIPCPHLLTVAIMCEKPYLELINPRWVLPTNQ